MLHLLNFSSLHQAKYRETVLTWVPKYFSHKNLDLYNIIIIVYMQVLCMSSIKLLIDILVLVVKYYSAF